MLPALGAQALVMLAGMALAALLWPGMRLVSPAFWGRALLLGPFGVCLQFLVQAAMGVPFDLAGVALTWAAILSLALFLRWKRRSMPREPLPRSSLLLFFLGALLFALSLGRSLRQPIHEGDPLTNFALPARVFAEARGVDYAALRDLEFFGHVEYPPLLAASEALVFEAAGDEGYLWNQLFGPLALLALFLLLAGQWFGQDPIPAPYSWLALLILMGTPLLLFQAGFATADLRLLAAFLLLGIEAQRRGTPILLMVLGLLCALTKMEGGLGLLVVLVLLWRRRREWGSEARGRTRVWAAAWGTLLLFGLWPALLLGHGLSPLGGFPWGLGLQNFGARISALSEYIRGIPFQTLSLGGGGWGDLVGGGLPSWGILWLFVPYLVLAFALKKMRGRKKPGPARAPQTEMGAFFFGLFLLHLGLFCLVFLLTPREIHWHLATAGDRFLLTTLAWPLLLLPRVLPSAS